MNTKGVTLLATPEGTWVQSGSEAFLDLIGEFDPDYNAEDFAVKNLGFVRFRSLGPSIFRVTLHPRNAAWGAVEATKLLLRSEARKGLVVIEHLGDEKWQSEVLTSAERANARLDELCGPFVDPAERVRRRRRLGGPSC